ncbi:ribonuclease H, partial [Trifolium pratense]
MRITDYAILLQNCFLNQQETMIPKLVRWNAHGGTGMILNVDGNNIGNHGISGYGGLIRNADGAWIHGFFGNLEVTNILHAELMAIYKGRHPPHHREGNVCADFLAKHGAHNNEVFTSIAVPPV